MELLLVRHARAEDREIFAEQGRADHERPLTDDGIERMLQIGKGLQKVYPRLDLILTSPYRRTLQTAEILHDRYGCKLQPCEALIPEEEPAALFELLGKLNPSRIALVGHEPDLGLIASRLLSASRESYLPLKKGGALLLELPSPPLVATAHLHWLLTPKQLRALSAT